MASTEGSAPQQGRIAQLEAELARFKRDQQITAEQSAAGWQQALTALLGKLQEKTEEAACATAALRACEAERDAARQDQELAVKAKRDAEERAEAHAAEVAALKASATEQQRLDEDKQTELKSKLRKAQVEATEEFRQRLQLIGSSAKLRAIKNHLERRVADLEGERRRTQEFAAERARQGVLASQLEMKKKPAAALPRLPQPLPSQLEMKKEPAAALPRAHEAGLQQLAPGGKALAYAMCILVILTIFGSCFAQLLGYSQIPYTAAKEGYFSPM